MAVSVRMDPVLERELEAAARRQGLTKSQFIIDAVERALGHKNPYELLLQVHQDRAEYRLADPSEPVVDAKVPTKERVRSALGEQHRARQQQWAAEHKPPAAKKRRPRSG